MLEFLIEIPFWMRSLVIGVVVGLISQAVPVFYMMRYLSALERIAQARGWMVEVDEERDGFVIQGQLDRLTFRFITRRERSAWGISYVSEVQIETLRDDLEAQRWLQSVAPKVVELLGGEVSSQGGLWCCVRESGFKFLKPARVEQIISTISVQSRRLQAQR
jgi:hypothetical protein